MFRYSKILPAAILVCAAAITTFFASGISAASGTSAGAVTTEQASAYCPEGCLVELHGGLDSRTDVYDADGRHLCSFTEYYGEQYPLMYFRGNIRITNYDEGIVLNLRTGRTVGVFPSDDYDASVYNDWILAENRAESALELYDAAGKLFASFDLTGEYQFWLIEDDPYILIQNGDSVEVTRCDSSSGECEKIESECFRNADVWDFYRIALLGDNYLITGSSHYRIVTKDWELLRFGDGYDMDERDYLEDVASGDREIKETFYFQEYSYDEDGTTVNYLNKDLEVVLSMPEEEAWEKNIRCRDGMLVGLPCDALGGHVLTGFAAGDGMRMNPYSFEDGSFIISSENGPVSFTLPEGLTLDDINNVYILARDDEWNPHLFRREDLQEISFPKDSAVSLGENGYVARVPINEEYDYETTLYDADQNIILQSTSSGFLFPWINATWYYRTDFSDGILNENGKWLLRRWNTRD